MSDHTAAVTRLLELVAPSGWRRPAQFSDAETMVVCYEVLCHEVVDDRLLTGRGPGAGARAAEAYGEARRILVAALQHGGA